MKVGTVFWHKNGASLSQEFEFLLDVGFDGIEVTISESFEGNAPFSARGYLNIENLMSDATELKKASEDTGLEIHSVRSGLLWKYPLTSPNPHIRKKAEEIVYLGLKVASFLGSTALLVVPGVVTEEVAYDDAYIMALSSLKRISSFAEKVDVNIGIENVGNNFLLSPLEMKRFIDEINSEKVGAYLDVGNVLALRQSFPQHWIKILANRIRKVHLKDFDLRTRNITYLLQGDVNWFEVIHWLKRIGYQDYLTAELSPYKSFHERFFEDTAKAIKFLIKL